MSDPQKLKEEADKLASSSGGFFSKIFGGGNKLEEACELYTQGTIARKPLAAFELDLIVKENIYKIYTYIYVFLQKDWFFFS